MTIQIWTYPRFASTANSERTGSQRFLWFCCLWFNPEVSWPIYSSADKINILILCFFTRCSFSQLHFSDDACWHERLAAHWSIYRTTALKSLICLFDMSRPVGVALAQVSVGTVSSNKLTQGRGRRCQEGWELHFSWSNTHEKLIIVCQRISDRKCQGACSQ